MHRIGDHGGQALRLQHRLAQQLGNIDPLTGAWHGTAFQAGQRQQVAHQRLHALGLLAHEPQEALAVGLLQRQALHGLHKAAEHRQRRADFMRDVGHKIPAHRVGQLHRRDIAREHQLPLVTIGVDLQRDLSGLGRTLAGTIDLDLGNEVTCVHVGVEARMPHEVAHVLPDVSLRIDAQVLRRRQVAPLDARHAVEQHDAVG